MLHRLHRLLGVRIAATDGDIGHVQEAYFDDQAWAIRYLVVDTGSWLTGRTVLLSPYAIRPPIGLDSPIDVNLTRAQVEDSPGIDLHRPVSRRHEQELLRFYNYPDYWSGGGLWAMGPTPMLAVLPEPAIELGVADEDVHLRSTAAVKGYDIRALDGTLGHVEDFLFDDGNWAIRYLVVDTRNWWPGGKRVLIATLWLDAVDWATKTVSVQLTREQIRNAPAYDEAVPLTRTEELRLHESYNRIGYWD